MEDLKYLELVDDEYVIKEEFLDQFKELKKNADEYAKKLKELSTDMYEELKTVFPETSKVSGFNFIVKGGHYTFDFDLESFKKDHLDLFVQYLKPKEVKKTYALAKAKRGE